MDHLNKETYTHIATNFDSTRQYLWAGVKQFIDELPSNSTLLDVGCGNGRNMMARQDIICTGCDFCPKFVQICQDKRLNVIEADCRSLPFPDDSFDNVICIAVVHHLEKEDDRKKAVEEMIRVLKPGGKLFVQVWSNHFTMKQHKYTSLETPGDYLINWNLRTEKKIFKRFYHMFSKSEFETLLNFKNTIRLSVFEEEENWCGIIKKE